MADISEQEVDFWRRQYGLHLISYTTSLDANNKRNHSGLLTLLDSLATKKPNPTACTLKDFNSPDVTLAIARYAAGLSRFPKVEPEFSIRVHPQESKKRELFYQPDKFYHSPVGDFLHEWTGCALLIGLPGAGKTYALRQAVAIWAKALQDYCLSEPIVKNKLIVPIFADLKTYSGDLYSFVEQTLPESLPLDELLKNFSVIIFLDSFNEIPQQLFDSGKYESDFSIFFSKTEGATIIIGSRTEDGLNNFGFSTYNLDFIDENIIKDELKKLNYTIDGRFSGEILRLLQRPFYFQYVQKGLVKLTNEPHPRDFYHILFREIECALNKRFNTDIGLKQLLAKVAFNTLNKGEETFLTAFLIEEIDKAITQSSETGLSGSDVVNWLISQVLLIPYTCGRIAFVHQSITEFLAAFEFASRYQSTQTNIKEIIQYRRWDQAIFLTISMLDIKTSQTMLKEIIQADFLLALGAVKYLESDRDEMLGLLLSEISDSNLDRSKFSYELMHAIEYTLPFTKVHEAILRKFIKKGDSIGAAALMRFVDLYGASVKDEILEMLLLKKDDFNFCVNGLAPSISMFISNTDIDKIVNWANKLAESFPTKKENKIEGFISGAGILLSKLDLSILREKLLVTDINNKVPWIHKDIICEILQDNHSTESLQFAGDLLLLEVDDAATTIYFIANFAESQSDLSWESFNINHVKCLLKNMKSAKETWNLKALKCICANSAILNDEVKLIADSTSGLEKVLLLYCTMFQDDSEILNELVDISKLSFEEQNMQPLYLIEDIDFNWEHKEDIFIVIFKSKSKKLISTLFHGSIPPEFLNLKKVDIGSVYWLLDWMIELTLNDDEFNNIWFLMQLGGFISKYLDPEQHMCIVEMFNRGDLKYRQLIFQFILPYFNNLNTDSFSEEAIQFLLKELKSKSRPNIYIGTILGATATDSFAKERLLPLLKTAKGKYRSNILGVLEEAGKRHGKRYVLN
ncbi:MAG: hypothetical protein HYV28_07765 [Ignavibacteriales bacterium]|nr:hypothetical protein [Ignavibacteriales bacterium]